MSSPIKSGHAPLESLTPTGGGGEASAKSSHPSSTSSSIVGPPSAVAYGNREVDVESIGRSRTSTSSVAGMHSLAQTMLHQSTYMSSGRGQEVRAIQAVPPFGIRESVVPSNILDECQVVKRLVREVVSGQLNPYPTPGSSEPVVMVEGCCYPTSTACAIHPPAYNSIFVRSLSPSPGYGGAVSKGESVRPESNEKTSLSQPDVSRLAVAHLPSGHFKLAAAHADQLRQCELVPSVNQLCRQQRQELQPSNLRHHSAPPPSYLISREGEEEDGRHAGESTHLRQMVDSERPVVSANDADVSSRMINLVSEENRYLRVELEGYIKKTFKLQQLELQYQKIEREYEDLVRRQDKREQLEQQMRGRMQTEIGRLKEVNLHLQNQLENVHQQIAYYQSEELEDSELRHEVTRRDMMIAQLITQNKELLAAKERQAIELDAQRETLEEQRGHIKVLDKALSNAQERVLRAEEQLQKKEAYVQKSDELQRALHALQESMNKREESHKKARADLEKKLALLQIQKKSEHQPSFSSRSLHDLENTIGALRHELQEKEETILNVQTELVRWQEAYYVELKKQEVAFSEASDTKDKRIRVLEENSDKAEKLIETSQSESRRFLDDLRMAKGKINDLETRQQQLEALLAEKEAMINVLRRRQQSSVDADGQGRSDDAALQSSISDLFSPLDNSKQRLEAVRRRLLQSPSPSWCQNRIYQKHSKFISVDSSYGLEEFDKTCRYSGSLGRPVGGGSRSIFKMGAVNNGRSGALVAQHVRTQSSCDAASTGSSKVKQHKNRDIFTLPARIKIRDCDVIGQERHRPRSADDHLLNAGQEAAADDALPTSKTTLVAGAEEASALSEDDSDEQLWNV